MKNTRRYFLGAIPIVLASRIDLVSEPTDLGGPVITPTGGAVLPVSWERLILSGAELNDKLIQIDGFFMTCEGLGETTGHYVFKSMEALQWRRIKSYIGLNTKAFIEALGTSHNYLGTLDANFISISGKWATSKHQEQEQTIGTLLPPFAFYFSGSSSISGNRFSTPR